MKIPFIYWEAPYNAQQALYGEKYPHYALLLDIHEDAWNGDSYIVLFFTHERQMILGSISKKDTGFVERAEVEIPFDICGSALRYMEAKQTLQAYCDQFLVYVAEHRRPIDVAQDVLREVELAEMPPDEALKARFMDQFGGVNQPFPREINKPK